MDSQHRHELQHNDLAEFIAHFQEWWEKHGFRTLLVVLVVLVAAFGYQVLKAQKKGAHDAAWNELDSATSPAAYEQVAKSREQPMIRAMAHLRGADLALNRAIGRKAIESEMAGPIPGEKSVEPDADREQMLKQAEAGYHAVIDMPEAALVLRLNALLGLASVAESRGQWDMARKTYQQVEGLVAPGYENFVAIAKGRTATMDRIATPVVFGKEPPPATTQPAATQPSATQPAR